MKLALLLLPFLALAQDTPAKASLEGHVVNAVGGEPLRKVRLTLRLNVAASPQSPPQPIVAGTTDATGKFLFENVEAGDYVLTARRDGFAAYTVGALIEGRKREPLVLGAGERKSGVVIKLTPHGVISGRVVDEDGDPVQGVPVSVMTWEYTSRGRELVERRTTSTDDRGEYRLYDVPAGRYLLKFAHRGLRIGRSDEAEYFVPAYFPGAPDAANAAPFEIRPGQQLTGMGGTLRKARLATLRGRVIAPPDVRVEVGLTISTDRGTASNSTGAMGKEHRFELNGLSPGPYILTAQYSANGQSFSAYLPVEVGAGDINGIELRPGPPLEVSGAIRIEGETAQKVSQLTIVAGMPGRSVLQTPKDDGAFVLRGLMPNVYSVGINPVPLLYTKSVHWGTAELPDGKLDLTAGVPPHTGLTIVIGADVGQVEGTVMNDREPAEDAVVTLIRNDGRPISRYIKWATVDAAGRFSIKGIAPGVYRLIAWDNVNVNAVQYDPDFLRPYATAGERITIEPNAKKTVELKLTANLSPAP